MYRHLLVPLDSSDLSIEVVGNAVGLARAVGARITFFRALPSGDSRTRELLAKAEAAARAFGVPCDSMQAAGDRPGSAIVEAAQAMDCDLVFMASHEARSPLDATLGVLMDAGLPVLVSSTRAPKAPAHAIGILRDEHRSIAAVLHAWLDMLSRARAEGGVADAALMQAMLRYLQEFPVAVHHPKEEAHLFSRLRERDPTNWNASTGEIGSCWPDWQNAWRRCHKPAAAMRPPSASSTRRCRPTRPSCGITWAARRR
jgi:nucleotide-binding universal stress UspA family protein